MVAINRQSHVRNTEHETARETEFHPDFPNHWQVAVDEPIQPRFLLPSIPEDGDRQGRQLGRDEIDTDRTNNNNRKPPPLLLPHQVVRGTIWDENWILMRQPEAFIPRSVVKPYFPVYRIVAESHKDSEGVAPYVLSGPEQQQQQQQMLQEELTFYNPDSPFRRADLSQPVGYVFHTPPLQQTPSDAPHEKNGSQWWTLDGETWWPTKVRRTIPCTTNALVPSWVPVLGTETVMELATPIEPVYIQQFLQKRNMRWILFMIFAEYLLIIVGATAGVELGWTVSLQVVYLFCLVQLVGFEIALVAKLVPNGRLWLNMNRSKLVGCILKGVLWRWDLYGDVGFCLLVYKERDNFLGPFWVVPTALTTVVIAGRLAACVYYLHGSQSWDEKTLSQVTIPSFLTVFGTLCQDLHFADTSLALSNARTEMQFEACRTIVEDIPEIFLQAFFLFGPQALPTCSQCGYGFVLVSLLASIATSFPGLVRLYTAFSRYTALRTKLESGDNKPPHKEKQTVVNSGETTERPDGSADVEW